MATNNNCPENEVASKNATTWKSHGLIIDVHKSIDSKLPPMKIDITSTLGASNNLPLAIKKSDRYWFSPDIKTKNDVVRYVNDTCRRNGFKISTLSNSQQGLDRRAQLVCSRGIVARKPRGKRQSVQTTTTRPVSRQEKCPFSLTVYECRKSARWYIRKYGNGSRIHCGHCRLLPEQVGIRRYQNLTERVGSDWCEGIDSSTDESDGRTCIRTTDEISSNRRDPNTTLNTIQNPDPQTLPKPQMPIRMGWCAAVAQNRDPRQNQIFDYIDRLRDRIAYRNYNDQLLLERARRFQDVEAEMNRFFGRGSSTTGHHRYYDAGSNIRDKVRNSGHGLLLDRIGALSQSNSTSNDRGLLKKYANDQILNSIDRSMLSNHIAMRELSSTLAQRNYFLRRGEDSVRNAASIIDGGHLPNILDLIGRRAETNFRDIDLKSRNATILNNRNQHRFSNSSITENEYSGQRNEDHFHQLSQSEKMQSKEELNDAKKGVQNAIPNHEENRRRSESLSESGKIGPCANSFDRGQNDSVCSKVIVANEIRSDRSIAHERSLPESARSNTCASRSNNERENRSEDHIETRKKVPNGSCGSPKSTPVADSIGSNPFAESIKEHANLEVDDYAMLRPMAIYDYPSRSEPEFAGREKTTNLKAQSSKRGLHTEESEQFRHKRQKSVNSSKRSFRKS